MISLTFIKAHGEEAVLKEAKETKALLCSDCLHPRVLHVCYLHIEQLCLLIWH